MSKVIAAMALALCAFGSCAFGADDSEMSLQLYQKIKAHFDVLYGAASTMLIDAKPPNKAETEKALRLDATENKDALIRALKDKEPLHREIAARALEYCADKKAVVAALSAVLNSDTDESVRRAIAGALGKVPDAASVDALIKGLADTSDSVRGACCAALGAIKDTRATDPLLNILKEESKPMVRLLGALALAKVKDPAALQKLKEALDTEKDDRVKMAIAGAIRGLLSEADKDKEKESAEEKVPTASEASDELQKLAKEMKEVEDKLREDRHDQAVQAQGSNIENKLSTLIEKLNKAGGGGQGTKKGDPQQQMQPGNKNGNKNNNGKSSGSPLKDSQLGASVPPGPTNPAMVAGKQDAWAKLPPAQRDELLQAFREEMPERWKKRLEAYFTSIAAEESGTENK